MIPLENRPGSPVERVVARSHIPYYLTALAMGIPAILIGIQISAWIIFLSFPNATWTRADFRDIYTSGYMVHSGYAHQLYELEVQREFQNRLVSERTSLLAFDHLAYETFLFVPFSYLHYPAAYFAFMAWNAALFVLSFVVLKPFFNGLSTVWKLLPSGIFLGFLPVTIALMLGQDSILMLALFSLSAVLLRKNDDLPAGALVGLAFFKFQIVIPIAFLFLVWRRWRFFAGICLSAVVATTASCMLVGLSGMHGYVKLLTSMSGDAAHYQYGLITVAMPNLRGLISAFIEGVVPAKVTQVLTISVSVLLMFWVGSAGRRASRRGDALPIAITAAALVSYHILIQDLSMLLIPISLTLEQCVGSNFWNRMSNRLKCYAAGIVLIVPSVAFLVTRYFCITALALVFLLISLLRSSPDHETADQEAMQGVPAGA
jgi:Glycosyltransferase family 87